MDWQLCYSSVPTPLFIYLVSLQWPEEVSFLMPGHLSRPLKSQSAQMTEPGAVPDP